MMIKDFANEWLLNYKDSFNIIKNTIFQEVYIAEKLIGKENISFSYINFDEV